MPNTSDYVSEVFQNKALELTSENVLLKKEILEKEIEIEKLTKEKDEGRWGGIGWLSQRTTWSTPTLKDRILYPHRKELEYKIVRYPKAKGQPWLINCAEMNKWLAENFGKVEW